MINRDADPCPKRQDHLSEDNLTKRVEKRLCSFSRLKICGRPLSGLRQWILSSYLVISKSREKKRPCIVQPIGYGGCEPRQLLARILFDSVTSHIMVGGTEQADGADGNDRILVVAGFNKLDGGNGNDQIYGGSARDVITDGDDILAAGAGNDGISGGPGINLVFGGSGLDFIHGGGA